MKAFLSLVLIFNLSLTFAQKEVFDIVSCTPPKGWSKELKTNVVLFTTIDNQKRTWCQIAVYKSMTSLGNIEKDFQHDWDDLIVKSLKTGGSPESAQNEEAEGWKIKSGGSKFLNNKEEAFTFLTTFSGFGVFTSIVANTNTQDHMPDIIAFTESIELQKPVVAQANTKTVAPSENKIAPAKAPLAATTSTSGAFGFTTTNFDDGWVGVAKEDWVEVTKGNVTVLLHYPKEGTIIAADPEPVINNAWNILVAPRYSNLRNYIVAKTITEYQRGYLSAGNLKDNKTGKEVYVALFRRLGNIWIEIITPDKNTFVQTFKVDPDQIRWDTSSDIWPPLDNMSTYNKFAVAASDLKGTWTSNFSGALQMYNTYTGSYAGMNVHQSNETFVFKGNNYNWKLGAANGMVGSIQFVNVESAGTFSLPNNWQLYCSKIESKPKTYHAYFTCIKGGRILWLMDASYTGGGYTGFGKGAD